MSLVVKGENTQQSVLITKNVCTGRKHFSLLLCLVERVRVQRFVDDSAPAVAAALQAARGHVLSEPE